MVEKNTVIVGGGPVGMFLLQQDPAHTYLVEAHQLEDVREIKKLLLINLEKSSSLNENLVIASEYKALKVRWEKNWIEAKDVDWGAKDWYRPKKISGISPYWERFFTGRFAPLKSVKFSEEPPAESIRERSPVSSLFRENDHWLLTHNDETIQCQNVLWASSLESLENALGGRQKLIPYLTNNKYYQEPWDEFAGGFYFNVSCQNGFQTDTNFDDHSLFGLPVKFEGCRFLVIGIKCDHDIKMFCHLPLEITSDVKRVASIQKALRRSLLNSFLADGDIKEYWSLEKHLNVVDAGLVNHWRSRSDGLEFLGEAIMDGVEGPRGWEDCFIHAERVAPKR